MKKLFALKVIATLILLSSCNLLEKKEINLRVVNSTNAPIYEVNYAGFYFGSLNVNETSSAYIVEANVNDDILTFASSGNYIEVDVTSWDSIKDGGEYILEVKHSRNNNYYSAVIYKFYPRHTINFTLNGINKSFYTLSPFSLEGSEYKSIFKEDGLSSDFENSLWITLPANVQTSQTLQYENSNFEVKYYDSNRDYWYLDSDTVNNNFILTVQEVDHTNKILKGNFSGKLVKYNYPDNYTIHLVSEQFEIPIE